MDELALAKELAAMADEIAMRHFSRQIETSIKKDGSIVTIADRQIEEAMRSRINQAFPEHSILGEEGGLEGDSSSPLWILDPIDGTNNYAAGIPVFGTLIALRVDGRNEVGVVSAPALGEQYEASRGGGAFMNGERIHVSEISSMSEATVCFGSYKRMFKKGYGEQVRNLLASCRRDRSFGDFWGHCLVARGSVEAMLEPNLNIWDIAAVEVIVEEAGGNTSGFDGERYPEARVWSRQDGEGSFLSTNGILHTDMVHLLAK
jgi:histidinol-phosphatase